MERVVNMEAGKIDHYKQELGAKGETYARELYEGKGFRVIEQNYKCKVGEIDLICMKDKLLVFCEVKGRVCLAFGIPAESVTEKKKRHIRRVASWYLSQGMRLNRLYNDFEMRFDVVEVVFADGKHEINHVENAFEGSGAI